MKLVSSEQMKCVDTTAHERYHIPTIVLMEHAAHEIYMKLRQDTPHTASFLLVCGTGNNGGDGLALARLLHIEGYTCQIALVGDVASLGEGALTNYKICQALRIPIDNTMRENTDFDVVVDALFGLGLQRPIEGIYAAWVAYINKRKARIISIDVPSGVDANNGCILGCAIHADTTYTLQSGKVGLYVYPGRGCAGQVHVLSIYIPQEIMDTCETSVHLIQSSDMYAYLPERTEHSHKGTYGKLLCVGGSESMSGALILATKSALSAGCGTMTCALPRCIQGVVQSHLPESMSLHLEEEEGHFALAAKDVLCHTVNEYTMTLVGCGIGRSSAVKSIVQALYETSAPLLIDADALDAMNGYWKDRSHTIITPHLKEFATLMGVPVSHVQERTWHYVDAFTQSHPHITLVLKSETTIVAQGNIRYINTYGNNGLATGGSGDVLAGVIAGLYAQTKNELQAAVLGVFLHAASADALLLHKSVYSVSASALIDQIEDTLFQLNGGQL